MLSLAAAFPAFAPVAAPLHAASRAAAPVMETKAELEALATQLNPVPFSLLPSIRIASWPGTAHTA